LKLVQIDSVSGQEGEIRDVLREELERLGLEVYEDQAGTALKGQAGNIVARLESEIEAPWLLLCAHMDTVEPGRGVKPEVKDDVVRSAGDTVLGGDDKAGIVAILEMLRVIQEKKLPHPPLEIVFTVSEEQGLMGSKELDCSQLKSRRGYVLDSGGPAGTIITQGPTQNELEIEITGKAAHAGMNPEAGINAISLAGHAISQLTVGRIDEETTCNLGTIKGGWARNIVPDSVVIKGEARSLNAGKLKQVTDHMTGVFRREVESRGGSCHVQVKHLYPEFSLRPDDDVVVTALKAARALGKEPVLTRSGGGSDANILNSWGIKCTNLGIDMTDVHTVQESIAIEALTDNALYLLKIIEAALAS
jgi:tripeptide aminopeptidase